MNESFVTRNAATLHRSSCAPKHGRDRAWLAALGMSLGTVVALISAIAVTVGITGVGAAPLQTAGSTTAIGTTPAGYHGIAPTRVIDTRDGTGTAATALGDGETRTLDLTGSKGIPAAGITAVVANLTVTGTTATSHLTTWPSGDLQPTASNLNWPAGDTRANLALLPVSVDGTINAFNNDGAAHLIIDIVGWYDGTSVEEPALRTTSPTRVIDTRDGTGTTATPFGDGETRTFDLTGTNGIPSSGVTAVVANLTVTGTTATSHLTVWPAGQPKPTASNLNWPAGDTRANLALLPVSVAGEINAFNNDGSTDVVIDVVGWFEALDVAPPTSASIPNGLQTTTPFRLLDTRDGTGTFSGPLTQGDFRTFTAAGVGPIPAVGVSAIIANVTVTSTTATSHLSAWAADRIKPSASNLNWPTGDTRANLAVIPLGADGRANIFNNSGQAQVIVDVVGWQTGPTLDIRLEGRGTISDIATVRVVPRGFTPSGVELFLDDLTSTPIATTNSAPPFTSTIDTSVLSNGNHVLLARSLDGSQAVVARQTIVVDNRSYNWANVTTGLQQKVNNVPLPGNALHVSHHGTQEYEQGFGTYTSETQMFIASSTKWISGATIMRLVDQGLLRLDMRVSELIPSFTGAKSSITLRQLLSFTSGIEPDAACVGNTSYGLADCVDVIAALPLKAPPGAQFRYGSSHLAVAARMAEVVTNKAWHLIVADEITTPLGLTVTRYVNTTNPNPAGSLVSNLNDYQRFLRMMWNDGELDGVRYLSTAAVEQMQMDQTRGAAMVAASGIRLTLGSRYGLAQWVDVVNPQTGALEISSPGAFGFYPWIDRARDTFGVYSVFNPTDGVSAGGWDIKDRVRFVIDG